MNVFVFSLYAVLITIVSLRPIDSAQLGHWDKAGHVVMYCLFALLGYRVASNRRNYLLLCAGIVVYGGLMEVAQSFTPGRIMSAYDLIANTLGVAAAIAITWAMSARRSD